MGFGTPQPPTANYLLSFTRFQMKKEMKETTKEISPKVSSLGHGAKWVN